MINMTKESRAILVDKLSTLTRRLAKERNTYSQYRFAGAIELLLATLGHNDFTHLYEPEMKEDKFLFIKFKREETYGEGMVREANAFLATEKNKTLWKV